MFNAALITKDYHILKVEAAKKLHKVAKIGGQDKYEVDD